MRDGTTLEVAAHERNPGHAWAQALDAPHRDAAKPRRFTPGAHGPSWPDGAATGRGAAHPAPTQAFWRQSERVIFAFGDPNAARPHDSHLRGAGQLHILGADGTRGNDAPTHSP